MVRQEQWRARRSAPPGRERGERERAVVGVCSPLRNRELYPSSARSGAGSRGRDPRLRASSARRAAGRRGRAPARRMDGDAVGGGATAAAVLNEGRGAVARGDRDPVKGQSEADIFS